MNPESDDESSELLNALLTEIQAELKKESLTGSLEFECPLFEKGDFIRLVISQAVIG